MAASIEELLGFADTTDNRPVYTGTVTSVSENGATVTLRDGRSALLPLGETPNQDLPAPGEALRFLELDSDSPTILSLTHPGLIPALLAGLVPELRTGELQVKGVSRLPGVRAKVAVASANPELDPVAAVVGRSANRVQELSKALNGERVDVIPWHEDRLQLLKNAFAPAELTTAAIDGRTAVASVPSHRMSAAVGRGGLNASLAGRLAGVHVTVVRDGVNLEDVLKQLNSEEAAA